jgi:predicted kinase
MPHVNYHAYNMRSILFYTVGYPGAGKTTFAKSLGHWLNADYLRGDKIGFELFHFPTYSPDEKKAVHKEMQHRASESLKKGRYVLYDAAMNTSRERGQLREFAKSCGAQAIGIWLRVPTEVAKRRAATVRDRTFTGSGPVARVIPSHIFDQYAAAFQAPQADENVLKVPGDVNFSIQYRQLQRQLREHNIKLPRIVN